MQENIKISKATTKNWERLNVNKKDITSKLSKRANKTLSEKKIIPTEYLLSKNTQTILNKIISINNNTKTTIYSIALNLLKSNDLIEIKNTKPFSKNKYLKEILKSFKVEEIEKELLSLELPQDENDILGIIYQSILSEGKKNIQGSYYTPQNIIKKALNNLNLTPHSKLLDPCCGTGSFLLAASDIIKTPENLCGFDIDEIACFIAKINLIIKFKNIEFCPMITNENFLYSDNHIFQPNIIATNPPWGAKNLDIPQNSFKNITSKESFSYIIQKSIEMIDKNGEMSFILPESILNIKRHSDIRKYILENTHINNIEILPPIFNNVMSKVIILHLDKNNKRSIILKQENETYEIPQDFYLKNDNYNFSILSAIDIKILEKIYSIKHQTLKHNSIWGLGIVTGNNSKFISAKKQSNFEKIYSGKNIEKGEILESSNFIKYQPKNFQQTASENIYRAPKKLVYKFITKKLTFALDTKQRLFLNSANILIPQIKGYSIEEVMAFLNSQVFQYIYEKKYSQIKILKENLSYLPFPEFDKEKYPKISDDIIFQVFNLTDAETSHIKNELN